MQHPFVTEFNERAVRVQVKDQLDRVKREVRQHFDEPLSDEEGGSLDPPTVKKHGEDAARPGPMAVSPTRVRNGGRGVCLAVCDCGDVCRMRRKRRMTTILTWVRRH